MISRAARASWTDDEAREYASLLDLANDAILVMDMEGCIDFWNWGAERLYGWSKAEARGRNAHELLGTSFPVPLTEILQRVRDEGQWHGRLVHNTREGRELKVDSRWTPRVDKQGRWVGSFEINRDVTEQEAAEQALRISEQRFQLAEMAANTWSWEYDLLTGQMRRSRSIEEIFGVPAESMPADTIGDVLAGIHPDDRHKIEELLAEGLRDRKMHEVEYRVVLPNGSVRWLLSKGRAVEGQSGNRVFGVSVDITARKQAEEITRSTERLTTLGRLVAAVAHEINNPLESIAGALHLIAGVAPQEEVQQLVKLANAEVERIAQITRETLHLARTAHVASRVDLTEVLDGVLALYAGRVSSQRVKVVKNYRGDPHVFAYSGELRQVFANLIGNALDAVRAGGTLKVHLRRRHWNQTSGVTVTISDSGPGIPDDVKRKLFEGFVSTKGEQGTGLGLWVARQIITKHGGKIRLRTSTRSRHLGTTFLVFLPDAPPFSSTKQGQAA